MLGAHYAVASFFETYPQSATLYCYEVVRERYDVREADNRRLAIGRVRVTSHVTRAAEDIGFAVLYLGDQTVTTGVQRGGADGFEGLADAFESDNESEVYHLFDRHFRHHQYHLGSLFGDEKRRIVDALLGTTLADAEASHVVVFEKHVATLRFLHELGVPAPAALSVAAEVVLNARLRRALEADVLDRDLVGKLLAEAAVEGVRLDHASLSFAARRALDAMATRFFDAPVDGGRLDALRDGVELVRSLPFEVDLRKVQNLYYRCFRAGLREDQDEAWQTAFDELGESLSMRLQEQEPTDAAQAGE
jgi:hypothetical protein